MRKTWSHLMISDIFYFIVDDTVFFPKDGKTYCPLTNLYSGNPLYPQKAKSFILTYFIFQGILGLPSRSWLTLSFFSLISRYSSIFKAFSMVLSKRKRPHRTVFPLYKVFIFSLFYSFPRLKIFAP